MPDMTLLPLWLLTAHALMWQLAYFWCCCHNVNGALLHRSLLPISYPVFIQISGSIGTLRLFGRKSNTNEKSLPWRHFLPLSCTFITNPLIPSFSWRITGFVTKVHERGRKWCQGKDFHPNNSKVPNSQGRLPQSWFSWFSMRRPSTPEGLRQMPTQYRYL